jgi:hypothetical protein
MIARHAGENLGTRASTRPLASEIPGGGAPGAQPDALSV